MNPGVLVVAETRRGELREISLQLVAAALRLKAAGCSPVIVAVVDRSPEGVADALAIDGVDRVVALRSAQAHFDPQIMTATIAGLVSRYAPGIVLAGHTADGIGWAPAVAASLGCGFVSDVVELRWRDGGPTAWRGAYGDRLRARVGFDGHDTAVVMLRPGAVEAVGRGPSGTVAHESADAVGTSGSEHLVLADPGGDDVEITAAELLVAIGRGVGDGDGVECVERLCERIGASLAVSRPVVEAGWSTASRLVGLSGHTVQPRVYLALGISGAVQHVAGIRRAGLVIAVNSDPHAPIFSAADVGVVADVVDFAAALESHVETQGQPEAPR